VKRHVAAAVALEDFYSAQSQLLRRQENIRSLCIPAQCDYRCVLEQKKNITDAVCLT